MDYIECEKCGHGYAVRDGCEPTPFCDSCAHEEVERLSIIIKPLVYLACPYSGSDAQKWSRFHAANLAAAKLMHGGLNVFSPISHTHPIAMDAGLPGDWQFWERYDRAFLSVSSKLVVLTLDGWKESTGVQAEIKIAGELGIPVEFMEPV